MPGIGDYCGMVVLPRQGDYACKPDRHVLGRKTDICMHLMNFSHMAEFH
jgi:hypothetical protein